MLLSCYSPMLRIAWTSSYVLPLPPHHRFPMSKYELLPMQLVHEGTITEGNLFHPDSISPDWLLRTHDPDYVCRLDELTLTPAEIRRSGFPLSDTVVKREKVIVNGALLTTHFAL